MTENGIKTSFWGPPAWTFLFSTIAGAYPSRFDPSNHGHQNKLKGFTQLFNSMKETLPCVYCRQSYIIFVKEIPMKDYTDSRRSMMYWLYLIHDKVNQKLITQEQECYRSELIKLKTKLKNKTITPTKYKSETTRIKKILVTKASPPFEKILHYYEKQRAGCNPKLKRCS